MTTTQEVTNGHLPQKGYLQDALFAGNKVSPPFLPSEIPDLPSPVASASPDAQPTAPGVTDTPAPERQTGPVAAGGYHFPPPHFSPRAHPYQHDDYLSYGKHPNPLPQRCQFMFSDGRQCTMARSDIHPSLCVYHSDREEQLFGDPRYNCDNRALDFPELHSACRDLSSARGVHRALAQVFRLLAQRRISRQEAATFAKLGHLLLQSISTMRLENLSNDACGEVVPSLKRSAGAFSPASLALKSQTSDLPSPATAPSHDAAPATTTPPAGSTPPILVAASAQRNAALAARSGTGSSLSAEHSELPQNQHLREIHPEPVRPTPQHPQNQHIQKCAT